MKFSCTQENLAQGLQLVSHVASKNTSLPILNNVLVKAVNKELKLMATNLETAISCRVRAKVDVDGEYTVPSHLFNEYVMVLSGNRVDLELKNDGLLLATDDGKTLIKGNGAADFPVLPQLVRDNVYAVLAEDFKHALQQVLFAVSKNEARPELSGVLFNFNPDYKPGYLVCAATDSYRLAERDLKMVVDSNKKYSQIAKKVIVPTRALQEVLRAVSVFHEDLEDNPAIEIVVADGQILFTYGSLEVYSRLVDGQYPDYRQIIPQNFKTTVNFNVADWIKRIKAASVFSNVGINGVAIALTGADDQKAVFTSTNGQLGEHTSQSLCQVEGENNNILINYRYLLDGLTNLGMEEAILKIVSPEAPCLLSAKGREGYLYIVMPIKQ